MIMAIIKLKNQNVFSVGKNTLLIKRLIKLLLKTMIDMLLPLLITITQTMSGGNQILV